MLDFGLYEGTGKGIHGRRLISRISMKESLVAVKWTFPKNATCQEVGGEFRKRIKVGLVQQKNWNCSTLS